MAQQIAGTLGMTLRGLALGSQNDQLGRIGHGLGRLVQGQLDLAPVALGRRPAEIDPDQQACHVRPGTWHRVSKFAISGEGFVEASHRFERLGERQTAGRGQRVQGDRTPACGIAPIHRPELPITLRQEDFGLIGQTGLSQQPRMDGLEVLCGFNPLAFTGLDAGLEILERLRQDVPPLHAVDHPAGFRPSVLVNQEVGKGP